jgi:hypothetical protein
LVQKAPPDKKGNQQTAASGEHKTEKDGQAWILVGPGVAFEMKKKDQQQKQNGGPEPVRDSRPEDLTHVFGVCGGATMVGHASTSR